MNMFYGPAVENTFGLSAVKRIFGPGPFRRHFPSRGSNPTPPWVFLSAGRDQTRNDTGLAWLHVDSQTGPKTPDPS